MKIVPHRCSGAVYEAEKVTIKADVYHRRCFTCNRCQRALDLMGAYVSPTDNHVYCKVLTTILPARDEPRSK